ncbi:MAG: HlyD family efflux transporter periplasmic adaptor subunit [Acidobacteria bacterium]|nr:HlyD family efflux transporter periplasmic adaptor subunit [Acidobacteriota bacterium]
MATRDQGPAPDEPRSTHEAILETLAGAVISLEAGGVVTIYNTAAAEITGLAPQTVVGRTFAEVFLPLEGADAFCETVLDAVYGGPLVRRRVVEATFPGGRRTLSMSVSRVLQGGGASTALTVVFDDISEIRELRQKELALAREVEDRHGELKEAYLRLEQRNRDLAEARKRTRLARFGGSAALLLLIGALAAFVLDFRPDPAPTRSIDGRDAPAETPTYLVGPQPLRAVVTVTGQLAPRREVDVTSPMTGKIAAVHVAYGARVEAGQALVELDVSETTVRRREAEAAYIGARERFERAEKWDESVEVSRARRDVTKARIDLENSRGQLEETAFLLERGVIPAAEHEAAERNFENRRLDLETAEQDLAVVVRKGTSDGQIARLELDNARARLDELDETLRLAVLRASIPGVVMRPREVPSAEERHQDRLVAGSSVAYGERLLTIGNIDGLSVVGRVDELDVAQIRPGNPVTVSGDAFPDAALRGAVTRVSSEALAKDPGDSPPSFEVVAVVDELTEGQRSLLRIGMSATLEVVVRDEEGVLLVPVEAVAVLDGETTVRIAEGDSVRTAPVTTGVTTFSSVEIVEGLKSGDRILLPAR